jgi:hypothetical protein
MNPEEQPPSASANAKNGDHRGNGKIARLPRTLRDQINVMIRDGVPFPAIRRKLQKLGNSEVDDISDQNFHNFKIAGHQRWLREQEWRDDMQQTRAEALEFIGSNDDSKLEQVTLKTAAMRLYQLFKHFDAVTFSAAVEDKPEAYTRLFSALPRITREALRYQKYRDACAQARAELAPLRDSKRKLTDEERRTIVRNVDEILGLASPDGPPDDNNPSA